MNVFDFPFGLIILFSFVGTETKKRTRRQIPSLELNKEFCLLTPSLNVESVERTTDRIYRPILQLHFYNKLQMYGANVPIQDLTCRGLPHGVKTRAVSMPNVKTNNDTTWLFDNRYNAYFRKVSNTVQLCGFNQVWLECPQPMCFTGYADAIFYDAPFNELVIIRGQYFWSQSLNKTASSKATSRIKDERLHHPDAAFCDSSGSLQVINRPIMSRAYIFKGNQIFNISGAMAEQVEIVQPTQLTSVTNIVYKDVLSARPGALAFQPELALYAFTATGCTPMVHDVSRRFSRNVVKCANYGFRDVEAAYIADMKMHLVKDWVVHIIPISSWVTLQNETLVKVSYFDHFFKCDEALYREANFPNKSYFINVFAKKRYPHPYRSQQIVLTNYATDAPTTEETRNIAWTLLSAIVVLSIVVSMLAIVVPSMYATLRLKMKTPWPDAPRSTISESVSATKSKSRKPPKKKKKKKVNK